MAAHWRTKNHDIKICKSEISRVKKALSAIRQKVSLKPTPSSIIEKWNYIAQYVRPRCNHHL